MEICAIASGSSGNCFYVGNNEGGLLVDAGISASQIVNGLNIIGKTPENIKGILITHEHTDHIKGADVFARHFNTPIFATKKTADSCFLASNPKLIKFIHNNEIFDISGMEISAFTKSHKAIDPVSFTIKNKKKVSIITDAGYSCDNILDQISNSDFICLESNHDENMLENGKYPYFLKKWIKSDTGHLSNKQAAISVLEYAKPKLKNIILSHLSENNNHPMAALKTFNSLLKERRDTNIKLEVSSRFSPTQLYGI